MTKLLQKILMRTKKERQKREKIICEKKNINVNNVIVISLNGKAIMTMTIITTCVAYNIINEKKMTKNK